MSEDEELERWRREWALTDEASEAVAEEVVRCAARDGRRMRWSFATEIVATLLSSVFCVGLTVRFRAEPAVAVVAAIVLFFNGAWLTHYATVRAGVFRGSGEDLASFVSLTLARLDVERRWARFARRWMAVLGGLLVPWAIWVFVDRYDRYHAEPWRAVVGFGGALAIFATVYLLARRREARMESERARFAAQLEDVRGG